MMLWSGSFSLFYMLDFLSPECKFQSPESSQKAAIKPKDASLAPPSGKNKASMMVLTTQEGAGRGKHLTRSPSEKLL